jgi:hypothetical protein
MGRKAFERSNQTDLRVFLSNLYGELAENPHSRETFGTGEGKCHLQGPLRSSIDYLKSDLATQSLKEDPYWPKWNSPWWQMTLLFEMGQAELIPSNILETFKAVTASHYIDVFPLKEEEIPPGCDTTRNIFCHCALGTAMQIFEGVGIKADENLPWVRAWFKRYQLEDGGYNCDEAAYLKEKPHSSIVSTLPMLETLLAFGKSRLARGDLDTLQRGANYLLARKLFKSLSKQDTVIDKDFLQLTFPRFYDYDILRGLSFVIAHANLAETSLNWRDIKQAFELIAAKLTNGYLPVERQFFADKTTLAKDVDGIWRRGRPVSVFPLLVETGELGKPSMFLTKKFASTIESLIGLNEMNLINFD